MQSPPGYDFLTFCFEFPNTIPSANPHGMADLRRFSVDKPCLQHFRNSIKNVERAAENRQNALQNHSWAPKNDPKGGQEDQKIEPKPQDEKRTEPRRLQDRLGLTQGARPPVQHSSPSPLGSHFGIQNGTKTEPKTIQNRSENTRGQKNDPRRSRTRLGAILGHFGAPS